MDDRSVQILREAGRLDTRSLFCVVDLGKIPDGLSAAGLTYRGLANAAQEVEIGMAAACIRVSSTPVPFRYNHVTGPPPLREFGFGRAMRGVYGVLRTRTACGVFCKTVFVLALAITPSGVRGQVQLQMYPIETVTLSSQQILSGEKNGKPTVLAGELLIPAGAGRLPAVILVHGSDGLTSAVERWAQKVNQDRSRSVLT